MSLLIVEADGRISACWDGGDRNAIQATLSANQRIIEADIVNARAISALYVVADVPIARPTMAVAIDKTTISANGIDVATLSYIPVGATMEITIGTSTSTRVCGEFESVSSVVSGDITITISNWPSLDFVASILAV
ncbi:hypothetical protein HC024_00120 [Methylococcaceae bacterium WWC4]|nr:hypothetical protein [Methylococcaceae bacterium WWC4]